jgi:hypothetical protein
MPRKNAESSLSASIEKLIREHLVNQQHEVTRVVARSFGKLSTLPMRQVGHRLPRRSSAEIEALSVRLLAGIKKMPGETMSELRREIGVSAEELILPSRLLKKKKQVKTVGAYSSMRYFPLS